MRWLRLGGFWLEDRLPSLVVPFWIAVLLLAVVRHRRRARKAFRQAETPGFPYCSVGTAPRVVP